MTSVNALVTLLEAFFNFNSVTLLLFYYRGLPFILLCIPYRALAMTS